MLKADFSTNHECCSIFFWLTYMFIFMVIVIVRVIVRVFVFVKSQSCSAVIFSTSFAVGESLKKLTILGMFVCLGKPQILRKRKWPHTLVCPLCSNKIIPCPDAGENTFIDIRLINSWANFWREKIFTFMGKGSKTSQELRMLSSVTINCQITKIVMNSGSQLSEL